MGNKSLRRKKHFGGGHGKVQTIPFSFDVHALIFSDNAPALESKLHEHFYNNRINKINNRKEFFRADITEIEKVIKDNYNKVVDIVKEASAEQYRESLLL
jgi:hypothetical protein